MRSQKLKQTAVPLYFSTSEADILAEWRTVGGSSYSRSTHRWRRDIISHLTAAISACILTAGARGKHVPRGLHDG